MTTGGPSIYPCLFDSLLIFEFFCVIFFLSLTTDDTRLDAFYDERIFDFGVFWTGHTYYYAIHMVIYTRGWWMHGWIFGNVMGYNGNEKWEMGGVHDREGRGEMYICRDTFRYLMRSEERWNVEYKNGIMMKILILVCC